MLLCCLQRSLGASCHTLRRRLPASTNSADYYQRLIDSPWSVASLAASDVDSTQVVTQRSQILAQKRDFCLPHLHSTPLLGGPRVGILPCRLVRKISNGLATRWWQNFEDIFIRFDTIHERDKQMNGRTPHDGIARACIASRAKNCKWNI